MLALALRLLHSWLGGFSAGAGEMTTSGSEPQQLERLVCIATAQEQRLEVAVFSTAPQPTALAAAQEL